MRSNSAAATYTGNPANRWAWASVSAFGSPCERRTSRNRWDTCKGSTPMQKQASLSSSTVVACAQVAAHSGNCATSATVGKSAECSKLPGCDGLRMTFPLLVFAACPAYACAMGEPVSRGTNQRCDSLAQPMRRCAGTRARGFEAPSAQSIYKLSSQRDVRPRKPEPERNGMTHCDKKRPNSLPEVES